MRYFIANEDNIPLHAQPENGYTELQVIARVHREQAEEKKLFGNNDYKWHILDNKFRRCVEIEECV